MRFSITLDVTDLISDALIDVASDDAIAASFVAFAYANARATFTNAVVANANDARFALDVTIEFDATHDDVRAYLDAFDADDDAIELVA